VRDRSRSARVASDVLGYMETAADAAARQDMHAMTQALAAAVSVYEKCPSEAHGTLSEIRRVLAFLLYARRLSRRLGWTDNGLRELQRRAEALRQAIH
jgi:hypothetical protein